MSSLCSVQLLNLCEGMNLGGLHIGRLFNVTLAVSPFQAHLYLTGYVNQSIPPGPLHKVSVSLDHECPIKYVAFSNDIENLVFITSFHIVAHWDLHQRNPSPITTPFILDNLTDVKCSDDGSQCVAGHYDGSVRLWDVQTGHPLHTLKTEDDSDWQRSVTLSSDKRMVASGSRHGIIRIWRTDTGAYLHGAIKGHLDWINTVAFSPDGSLLASGSDDRMIRLWNTEDGRELITIKGHTHDVESVAFSPGADQLISGSRDSTVRIWETASGKEMMKLEGHSVGVLCAAFSPKQNFAVSGSDDGDVQVWDLTSGETLVVYKTGDSVRSVAFSGNGEQIITGSDNGYAHIWDTSFLL